EEEIRLLTKAAKQRRESIEVFRSQGREDLAEKEEAELNVIERFLPKQLTEDELKEKLRSIIERLGATSAADIGKVMGVATKELAGQADGKTISALARALLA
ncbi:MAG: GatB/YqeY domain-containing protein, partial [Spirosomataceae bacterium]